MTVVLVCGGRDFANYALLERVLDRRHGMLTFTRVVHGAARGADTMAGRWAAERGVPFVSYPANWETYGKRAGPLRNTEMLQLEKPDLVIAFPGGKGTADMVGKAHTAGVRVIRIREGAEE